MEGLDLTLPGRTTLAFVFKTEPLNAVRGSGAYWCDRERGFGSLDWERGPGRLRVEVSIHPWMVLGVSDFLAGSKYKDVLALIHGRWKRCSAFEPAELQQLAVALARGIGTENKKLFPAFRRDVCEIDFCWPFSLKLSSKSRAEFSSAVTKGASTEKYRRKRYERCESVAYGWAHEV
jgi:hypothetical protein